MFTYRRKQEKKNSSFIFYFGLEGDMMATYTEEE